MARLALHLTAMALCLAAPAAAQPGQASIFHQGILEGRLTGASPRDARDFAYQDFDIVAEPGRRAVINVAFAGPALDIELSRGGEVVARGRRDPLGMEAPLAFDTGAGGAYRLRVTGAASGTDGFRIRGRYADAQAPMDIGRLRVVDERAREDDQAFRLQPLTPPSARTATGDADEACRDNPAAEQVRRSLERRDSPPPPGTTSRTVGAQFITCNRNERR